VIVEAPEIEPVDPTINAAATSSHNPLRAARFLRRTQQPFKYSSICEVNIPT